jgi:hypothetical protein
MKIIAKRIASPVLCGLTVVGGTAMAQQAGPGMMGGGGPGMMRGGSDMMGGTAYTDMAAYLEGLKTQLNITAAQEPAWNEYADTVKQSSAQVQEAHQSMYDAMGTATWQERQAMMNRMFETRQQSFQTVHGAAEKLLPNLDKPQQTKAMASLPGLRTHGPAMMGRRGSL